MASSVLTDFYRGETKRFQITLKLDGAAQNVTTDKVWSYLYNAEGGMILSVKADVATSGAGGIALFTWTPDHTKQAAAGAYAAEIVWELSGGARYVAYKGAVNCLERFSPISSTREQ